MSRRVWTGILAGTLAALAVLSIALGAYRAGQHSDAVTRTVTDGEVVRVIDGPGRHGPGPGFFLFPLLIIVLVVFLLGGRRHWYGGWNRPYGPGPWGPGPWGPGPGPGAADPAFEEWHRRAHEGKERAGPQPQADRPA
jgi:hypothetical protein